MIMIYLIVGLVLLALPFLLIGFFKDKKAGFAYVAFFWILFHTILALAAQYLGVFNFLVIFSANILSVLCAVIFIFYKKLNFQRVKVDWMIVFIILVSVISLLQVHYNFTGKINLATDQTIAYHDVKNMVYPYPYYSDEWDAVSFIKYSISSGLLPFKNPLDNNFYINFAAAFYSFFAELSLLLKIDPLLSFNFFSIFISTLIVVLGYVFLRINKVPKTISAISSLFLIYVPSAANLPGMWHLIPIHMGIVFSLIGFCFISLNKTKMAFLPAIMVLLFYPPLILFYGLALAVFLFSKLDINKIEIKKTIIYSVLGMFLALSIILILYFKIFNIPLIYKALDLIVSRIFYPSFSRSFIGQYNFYDIIPVFCLIFSIFGLYYVFSNLKWLFSQIFLGAIFWVLYSHVTYRIIIDYERIIFFTSIIVILSSAFGFKIICDYIDSRWKTMKYPISLFLQAGFVLFFVLSIPFYTSQNKWQKFILIDPNSGTKLYPKAVANSYLVEDDMRIFKDIKQKKFLSIPWKGLVIGVATNNYPAVIKEGMISVGSAQTVSQFISADCSGKTNMAKNLKLDYIYLYNFNCKGFEKIDQSQEGFILYKVI